MAIKRGGPGGPRVPPRSNGEQPAESAQRRGDPKTTAPKSGAPSSEGPITAEVRAVSSYDADGFDDEISGPGVQRSTPGDRAEDVLRSEPRSSTVRNTERLLETTYDRLASEYAAVHAEARALVEELASQSFSGTALDEAGPELRQQRGRMRKVRARLSTIRRRLRSIALPAGTALDLQLEQRLGAQIRAVSDLERGAERALMALQLATTFRPRTADGLPAQVVRVNVEGAGERDQLGSELAREAPDATTTQTMLRLLTGEGPREVTPRSSSENARSDVAALRSFAAAQIGT